MFLKRKRRGFTLLENLIGLAVVGAVSGLFVVAYKNTVDETKAVKCLHQLRQIGLASHQYAADNQGQLPQSTHSKVKSKMWQQVLKDYNIPTPMRKSPLDTTGRSTSYAINDFITVNPHGTENLDFSRIQCIPMPAQTLLMGVLSTSQQSDHFHFAESGHTTTMVKEEIWVEMYNQSSNYLFVDGHAQALKWEHLQTELQRPNSRFIRPDGIQ